ncbi:hypothetical protein [Paenibacillus sp. Marseille-Q4541]|uniref:hypothetical protein n=1 Tax=Paenibacillus sp. Marseille-Q4541 TaxID=2831522 RepID=UPI001BA846E3|nr:hypothetical protein [Paenibacillus sp. Marseille-Q4541]
MSNKHQPFSLPVQALWQGIAELMYAYALIVVFSVFVLHLPPLIVLSIYFIAISAGILGGKALFNNRIRIASFVSTLTGMLITVGGFMLWPMDDSLILIIAGSITGAVAGYRGFYLQKYIQDSVSISVKYQLFGLLTLVILSLISSNVPQLTEARLSVYICGLAGFILFIWTRHTQEMRKVSLDPVGHKPLVRSFIKHNQHRILIFLAVVLILGTLQRLSELASYLWSMFTTWLSRQFGGEPPQEQMPVSPDLPQAPPLLFPEDDKIYKETAPFWEWIMKGIAVLAVMVFLGFILFKVWKMFQKLLRYLDARKGKIAPATPPKPAYVDIEETIEERPKKNWFRFFQKGSVPSDPQQRIRYYYRDYVMRAKGQGYELPSHLTPFEIKHELEKINAEAAMAAAAEKNSKRRKDSKSNVPSDLIPLYNEVRYGERKVSPEALLKIDKDWKTHQ